MSRRTWGSSLIAMLLVALAVLPASAQSTSPETAARTTAIAAPTKFETELLSYLNSRRAAIGCSKLVYNAYLALASKRHNALMVRAGYLSHQYPGESSLGVRVTNAGYTGWRMLAENLAYGPTSPWGVYKVWMQSSGHRANIENCSLREAGFGMAYPDGKAWVTLDLGRR